MAGLPELSASTKRKLALQWDGLLDQHRLSAQHLDRYASANDRIRRIALERVPGNSRWSDSWLRQHERARQECGISPSVAVAKERFVIVASEYWRLWESSGAGYEAYCGQLELLIGQRLAEVEPLLEHRGYAHH